MRCLVTGSTGYIGGRLAPRLIAAGHTVRALVRTPTKLAGAPWVDSDTIVKGDLADFDCLADAFADIDVVYHLVHSMGGEKDFAQHEREVAHNVARAASAAGVRRIVYLGGLHPANAALSHHLSSRVEVGEILIDSGVETVVLQAGVVIGSGSASFELIRHLTNRLPVMTTPRWVHNTVTPIGIADALHYLVQAATAPVPTSRTWDIGSTEVLEYGDVMQIYAAAAGLPRRRMVVMPFLTPTIASHWVDTVTPIPGALARPLVESLQCDAVMATYDIDTIIDRPAGGLTTYRDAVNAALSRTYVADTSIDWDNAFAEASPALPLPTDPSWAGEDVFIDDVRVRSTASSESLWNAVVQLGGETQRSAIGVGWRIRTAIDGALGGPGNRRACGTDVGQALDWWRIEDIHPGRSMRLRAETKLPGTAFLTLTITGDELHLRTTFYPRGLAGLAYWYGQQFAHRRIFTAMARAIAHAAERTSPH